MFGADDFLGGLASRRTNPLAIVVASQGGGLLLLVLILPLLPEATPATRDLVWGGVAGLTGGIGVTLLYRALTVGRMAVVAPTTAVCAVKIPVLASVMLGERLGPVTMLGIAPAGHPLRGAQRHGNPVVAVPRKYHHPCAAGAWRATQRLAGERGGVRAPRDHSPRRRFAAVVALPQYEH